MKLFLFPPSPHSLRVQAVANHLGIDLEYEIVDLTKGEHMSDEFIKKNPNHKIPVLVDGDMVLWESTSIIQYLADKAPEAGLVPAAKTDYFRMQQWLAWNLTSFTPQCTIYIFERLAKKIFNMGKADEAEIAKADEGFHRYAKVLDDQLKDNNYILGDSITLADYAISACLVYAQRAVMPLDNYQDIQRWWGELQSSGPWQKALQILKTFKID